MTCGKKLVISGSPRHAKAIGQLVCKSQKAVMGPVSDFLGLDLFEVD